MYGGHSQHHTRTCSHLKFWRKGWRTSFNKSFRKGDKMLRVSRRTRSSWGDNVWLDWQKTWLRVTSYLSLVSLRPNLLFGFVSSFEGNLAQSVRVGCIGSIAQKWWDDLDLALHVLYSSLFLYLGSEICRGPLGLVDWRRMMGHLTSWNFGDPVTIGCLSFCYCFEDSLLSLVVCRARILDFFGSSPLMVDLGTFRGQRFDWGSV